MLLTALKILSMIAVVLLPLSYVKQYLYIREHKETRDFDPKALFMTASVYIILGLESVVIGSGIFFTKNVLALIAISFLIHIILKYRKNEWHDDEDKECPHCGNEIEPKWKFCPDCGSKNLDKTN